MLTAEKNSHGVCYKENQLFCITLEPDIIGKQMTTLFHIILTRENK